jgi:rhodanese-related sulfurtransferase
VREADELKEGQIDGAISLPLGRLIREARHGDLNGIKRKKIYTCCSGGYRVNMAADELNKQGFNATNIEGVILHGKNKNKKNDDGAK